MPDSGAPELVRIEVRLVDPWPKNPRGAVRDEDVADIVSTLRVVDGRPVDELSGIREPLWLRPSGDGRYESIKGARRTRAASLAGLLEVDARIVYLDDARALEEALVDDAKKPLGPLEEAHALAQLRGSQGWDDKTIADRTGKTLRTVRKRLALIDALRPEVRSALAAGKISLGLAEDLATLSPETGDPAKLAPQAAALAAALMRWRPGQEPVSRSDGSWDVQRQRLRLVGAGFPLDDATLVPAAGTCTTCPKRSGVQTEFFADGIADKDMCGDPKCFAAKRDAATERATAKARAASIPIADRPAETKKLFGYTSGGAAPIAHDAGVIDLDARCELVRPPPAAKPKGAKVEPRRGGPEKCSDPAYGGEHEYGLVSTAEHQPEHEAAKLGVTSWGECNGADASGNACTAWEEILEEDDAGNAVPPGWKPPTWREALTAAAKGDAPKPSLVAVDPAGAAHELLDARAATKVLAQAGMIRESEVRAAGGGGSSRAKPKKKGLDKWAIEKKAGDEAAEQALVAIVTKAKKADGGGIRLWKAIAAVLTHTYLSTIEDAAERRRPPPPAAEPAKGKGGKPPKTSKPATKGDAHEEELRAWVAKQTDEGEVRALVVELLTGEGHRHGEESGLDILSRLYGVDLAKMKAEALERITAAEKEKAKPKGKAAAKGAGDRIWAGKGLAHHRAATGTGSLTRCGITIKPTWSTPPATVKACEWCATSAKQEKATKQTALPGRSPAAQSKPPAKKTAAKTAAKPKAKR